jgi:hypothetical protein
MELIDKKIRNRYKNCEHDWTLSFHPEDQSKLGWYCISCKEFKQTSKPE